MAESYGTDGRYRANGTPAIIRRPAEAGQTEEQFFATLTAGLLFGKKFHLDAAWLLNSRIADLVANKQTSIYRLIFKDHIGILCRLPFEQMKGELEANPVIWELLEQKVYRDGGRVWDWPTLNRPVIPKPASNDGQFLVPGRAEPAQTLVAAEDKQQVGIDLAKHFAPATITDQDVAPPERFWSVLNTHTNCSPQPTAASDPPSLMEERLCAVSFSDFETALQGAKIDRVLGSFRPESEERNEICRQACHSLTSGNPVARTVSLEMLRDATQQIAKILGIQTVEDPGNEGFYVSVRDAMTFVLSWD